MRGEQVYYFGTSLRTLYYYSSKFSWLAQILLAVFALSNRRLGLFSRQDAKNAKFGKHLFLCGLCAFARDIPIFGCGFAALGLCGEEGFEYLTAEARKAQRRASRTNPQRTPRLCGEYTFTGNPEFESQSKI
jgi:hypothetical protein